MRTTRWLTADDHAAMQSAAELTARVFSEQDDEYVYEEVLAQMQAAFVACPVLRPDLCAVVLDGERVVAKLQFLDLAVRVGRAEVRCVGMHAAVSEPGETGTLARLLPFCQERLVREYDMALAFTPRGALYARLGLATLGAEYEWSIETRLVPRLKDDPFRPFDEGDDLGALLAWHARSNAERTGSLVRTAGIWPWLRRRPPEIWISNEGYLGIRRHADSIEVCEVGGVDAAFYHRALRKVAALAKSAGHRRITGSIPIDHPFAAGSTLYGATVDIRYPIAAGMMGYIGSVPMFVAAIRGELERRFDASRFATEQVALEFAPPDSDGCVVPLGGSDSARPTRHLRLGLRKKELLQACFGVTQIEALLPDQYDEQGRAILEVLFPKGNPFCWTGDRW